MEYVVKNLITILLALCGFNYAETASAQIYVPPINMTPRFYVGAYQQQDDAKRHNVPTVDREIVKNSPQISLSFKPSMVSRRQNIESFINKNSALNPGSEAEIRSFLTDGDIFKTISNGIAPFGLQTNNLADAYTVWWVSMWEASHGILESSFDRKSAQAVKAQVEINMLSIQKISSSSELDKQKLAEELFMQSALIAAMQAGVSTDEGQKRIVADNARKVALATGLDLDKMTLTEDGFVPAKPRKRADASDAVGDDATALASTDTGGTRDDSSAPNYALIAGAAGAGLGAAFLIGKAMGRKG